MNKLEEEYKNRFKNLGSLKGIDPDQLWDNISENLGDSPTPVPPVKYNRQIVKWSGLLILLFLLGGLLCYNFKTQKPQNANKASLPLETQKSSNDPLPHVSNKTEVNGLKNESATVKNNIDQSQNTLLKQGKNSTINPDLNSKLIPQTRFKSVSERNNFNTKTNQAKDLKTNKNFIAKNNSSTSIADTPTIIQQKDNEIPNSSVDKDANKKVQSKSYVQSIRRTFSSSISSLPTLSFFIKNNYHKTLNTPFVKKKTSKKPKVKNYFEIAGYTGTNTLFLNYNNGSLSNELSEATSGQLGWSNAFRVSWIFNEKYSINSGIDHDLIRLKFSATKETASTFTDDNYLIRFGIDPQSGDTINQEYITKDRDVLFTRKVVHSNHFNLISIPLEFGFQKQKGNLGYGIKLGASASFFISQKGKTLDSNKDIYTINDQYDDLLPFKKFFISYQINPFVDYSLSEKLKVRLSPVFKYQAFGKSRLYGLNQSGIFVGLNGGLVLKMSE